MHGRVSFTVSFQILEKVYLPFIDHVRTQLRERFSKHKYLISSLQKVIPKFCICCEPSDLKECIEFYSALLPEPKAFSTEFMIWKTKWSKILEASRPGSAVEACGECTSEFYPNINKLLKILVTLPISTSTAERSFSTLKRLKTYLRNSTGENRLTGLALLSVHRTIPVDPSEVVRRFALKPRRENFVL